MKQEIKDIAVELATKTAPAGGLAAWSAHWWVTINWTAVMTGVLVVLQIAFLLRKWWLLETGVGRWMKRKAGRPLTTIPAMLVDE